MVNIFGKVTISKNVVVVSRTCSSGYIEIFFLLPGRFVNIWNSLLDSMVEADSINSFRSRLDKHWAHQEVIFNFISELIVTDGGLPVCM